MSEMSSKTMRLAPNKVGIDMRVQRALDPRRVKELSAKFNPHALGVLTASQRPDETYVYLDGQTRAEVLRLRGEGHIPVLTIVYFGLSVPEEAAMFRTLNDTKKLGASDDFRMAVEMNDPIAVRANRVLNTFGWTAETGKTKTFRAVNTLYNWVERDEYATKSALMVLSGTWGASPAAAHASLVAGFCLFIHRYGKSHSMDYSSFIQRLQKQKEHTPQAFLGRCRANKDARGIGLPDAVADVLVGVYNANRRDGKGKVPTWTTA